MTPGLAGFTASGRDEHAWEESVAGVLAALAAEFEMIPERGGKPERGGFEPSARGEGNRAFGDILAGMASIGALLDAGL